MIRALILTASYGSGHLAAAAAPAAAFRGVGADVTVVDHFRELVHPAIARAAQALYAAILRRAPGASPMAPGIAWPPSRRSRSA